MPTMSRRLRSAAAGMGALLCAGLVATVVVSPAAAAEGTDPSGTLPLLSDPFLQLPGDDSVSVVWATEYAGDLNTVLVGAGVAALDGEQAVAAAQGATFPEVRAFPAESRRFSRMVEDSASNIPVRPEPGAIVEREVWRHEAIVTGLAAGARVPYRVVSTEEDGWAASGVFSLAPAPRPGDDLKVLLTSDHQAMANTPANLQLAAQTIGDIDAVFLAGDLVNQPDRASEWFDDTRGSAFLATLQGNGGRASTEGTSYAGGEIIQNAPLYPAIGNHEVQGAIAGKSSIGSSFNAPVPVAIAEAAYEAVAAEVNPTGDPAVRAEWIEDNSFSTTTYEEMFTLPTDSPGGERYYAVTVGDVRLVSLFSTRIWRGTAANANPAERTASSRYQEAASTLGDPLAQGYGEHIFEPLGVGSEQYAWLQGELASDEFQNARFRVVMLHEGPQGLGDNVMPAFADPVRIEEHDDAGELIGVRYEYPSENNVLMRDVSPLLEGAGVDLVHNGHSHLWNRFLSPNGVNYLETSNTGNSYGAYHPLSGRSRPLPPEPWTASDYLAQGNPGGLDPIVPNVRPYLAEDGTPLPFVQSNDLAVFSVLDTGAGNVTSYVYDVTTPDVPPFVLDVFELGRPAVDEPDPVDPAPVDPQPGDPGMPGAPGAGDGSDTDASAGTKDAELANTGVQGATATMSALAAAGVLAAGAALLGWRAARRRRA